MTGIDVVPDLVGEACRAGAGVYRTLSHEALAAGQLQIAADAIVCNFSLLGRESVDGPFVAFRSFLNPHGVVIVQTLHPLIAGGDHPYEDGWRAGSWAGMAWDFTDPAPGYFRTLGNRTGHFHRGEAALSCRP